MNRIIQSPLNQQGMFAANPYAIGRQGTAGEKEQKNGSIFAGSLSFLHDPIMEKKKQAKEEAMKLIHDVFQDDMKEFEGMKDREARIAQLQSRNQDNRGKLSDIENMREALMEEYGISEDDQEHQDLELIRKAKEAENPFSEVELSDEEQKRYDELAAKGFTLYQQRSLSLDEDVAAINKNTADNKLQIAIEMDEIENTLMQRLKNHKMTDAKNQADTILEAARKEAVGALFDEAKEHVDEVTREEKEKQEEKLKEEKKEEVEETEQELKKVEREVHLSQSKEEARTRAAQRASQAKADISGEGIDNMQGVVNKTNEAAINGTEQEIKELLEKMKLLSEDLKGAAVDGTV